MKSISIKIFLLSICITSCGLSNKKSSSITVSNVTVDVLPSGYVCIYNTYRHPILMNTDSVSALDIDNIIVRGSTNMVLVILPHRTYTYSVYNSPILINIVNTKQNFDKNGKM